MNHTVIAFMVINNILIIIKEKINRLPLQFKIPVNRATKILALCTFFYSVSAQNTKFSDVDYLQRRLHLM
jgi:hypothetical protein